MKRRIISVTVLILVFFVSFQILYCTLGFVPIIGRGIANSKISSYCKHAIKTRYDIVDGTYFVVDDNDYCHIKYNLKNNTIYDPAVNALSQGVIDEKYILFKELFSSDELAFSKSLTVWTAVDADDYAVNYTKLYIMTI